MPRVYTRKYHRVLDDLFDFVLFCNLDETPLTEKMRDELLEWLWRQMRHHHKSFPIRPGSGRTNIEPPPPRSLQLISRYEQLKIENGQARGPGQRSKELLMKEFGMKRDAVEKALYRAYKKHFPGRVARRRKKIDDAEIPV